MPAPGTQPEFEGNPLDLSDDEFAAHLGLPATEDTEPAETIEEEVADAEPKEDAGDEVDGNAEDEGGEDAEESEAPSEDDEEEDDEGEEDVKPEAEKPEKPEKPAKATDFTVLDADGDEVEIPEDLLFTFKADGKERKLPLDRVVRLAQNGYYNEKVQEEVTEARTKLPELQRRAEQAAESAESLKEFARRLLEDDDYLLEKRAEYVKNNSPESQLERARAKLNEEKARVQNEALKVRAEQFVETELLPSFQRIQQQNPDVSAEELWGRWSLITEQYEVNGAVPPKHWDKLRSLVEDDLAPWAAQVNLRRSERVTKANNESAEEKRKARVAVTKLKRKVAKAVAPKGSRTSGRTTAKKPKSIETADDAVDDILGSLQLP